MILYFADRKMNIIGQASTSLPNGLTIYDDLKTEDIETGVASFECRIPYDKKTRKEVENMAAVGNYILRSNGDENEFYTIIDSEGNTRDQEVYVYAEDAGLDLLNEIVGDFEAKEAKPISWYIEQFAYDSGFEIGLNEASKLTRKLSWEGEETVASRIASVATQFDGCEISYSFKVDGLVVKNKYINIHKKRGIDTGVQLRLNKEIDRIITKQSIANLATALKCKGGTPEDDKKPVPITLKGYKYDDGDFYVDGDLLKSRKAVKIWSRYVWNKEPNKLTKGQGHIVRPYEYDTLSQATLCAHAITELKKAREIEVNYEVDINRLPKGVKIGDRVNIIDDEIGLYVSARILMFETSVVDQEQKATIGEYLIKTNGISQKVEDMAAKFAEYAYSTSQAKQIANEAKQAAETANTQAQGALQSAQEAQSAAQEAKQASETATQSANEATQKSNEAKQAVEGVQQSVADMEQTVADAEAAAEQARQAAETAQTKAEEAHTASVNAGQQAQTAEQKANEAAVKANEAIEKGNSAQSTAEQAQQQAVDASTTALAAKQDAQKAQEDIDALGEGLTTLEETMTAEYSRKTELTESEARLQAQITKNAGEIASNVSKIQIIDETANNAADKAQQAQTKAQQAQAEAEQAQADATEAQTKAEEAKAAAQTAQTEADTAKAAAQTAQQVADQAQADLEAAQADLATLQGRADATEADILAAQQKVNEAQAAANKAQTDADTATHKATEAQENANKAVTDAENAQTLANEASGKANLAQQVANEAKTNAEAAQTVANEAKETAQQAQNAANEAKTNATNAQIIADQAKADALAAQQAADEADAKAQQAQADLTTAQQNLENVTSRVGATEEEIEKAKADVLTAQAAADKAKADAVTAQQAADQAKSDAQTAQNAADKAQAKADEAQKAADDAQASADKAQADVDALSVRVTKTETDIQQTSEQIKLLATKKEVTQTLGGYYTKEESDANLTVKADEINAEVTRKIAEVEVGGRNLLLKTNPVQWIDEWVAWQRGTITLLDDRWVEVEKAEASTQNGIYMPKISHIPGQGKYMLSFDAYADSDAQIDYCYIMNADGNVSLEIVVPITTVPTRYRIQLNIASEYSECSVMIGTRNGDTFYVRDIQLECGTKATEWQPAPEDVSIDLQAQIVEQTANAIIEADRMLVSALESYVKSDDYGTFKETVQMQLEALADKLTLSFTQAQKATSAVNDDLQKKFNEITTYFTFDINGLIIGKTDNPYKMVLSNERYSMTVDGKEVMYIDSVTKMAYFPQLTITDSFNMLGYMCEHGEVEGLVNIDWIGGA